MILFLHFIVSCPEENGVFPDPGDHYFFVTCNQGIAQRKKCPSGTIYSKENKECIKEKDGKFFFILR